MMIRLVRERERDIIGSKKSKYGVIVDFLKECNERIFIFVDVNT